jgi:hypothetical protein
MIKFLALDIFDCCRINNLSYAYVISTIGEIFNDINKISPIVEMTEKKLDHRVISFYRSSFHRFVLEMLKV